LAQVGQQHPAVVLAVGAEQILDFIRLQQQSVAVEVVHMQIMVFLQQAVRVAVVVVVFLEELVVPLEQPDRDLLEELVELLIGQVVVAEVRAVLGQMLQALHLT
jgi:hypothetical protein